MSEQVDHPAHYGGADNTYEAIKVIEAWSLGFCLGNTIKYISRAGKKHDLLEDLKKAAWYLNREIERLERGLAMSSSVQNKPFALDACMEHDRGYVCNLPKYHGGEHVGSTLTTVHAWTTTLAPKTALQLFRDVAEKHVPTEQLAAFEERVEARRLRKEERKAQV